MQFEDVHVDAEFEALCPLLLEAEQQGLLANIERDGFRDPLTAWQEERLLLDGHNRHRLYREVFKDRPDIAPPQVVAISLADRNAAREWIIRHQFGRRNLTLMQRAELALMLEPLIQERAKQNKRDGNARGGSLSSKSPQNSVETYNAAASPLPTAVDTQKELAKIAGVSHDTIAKAKLITAQADAHLLADVRNGRVSIHRAYQRVRGKSHEKPAQQPAAQPSATNPATPASPSTCPWDSALHQLYKAVSSTRGSGRLRDLAENWPANNRREHLTNLLQIRRELQQWVAVLEGLNRP